MNKPISLVKQVKALLLKQKLFYNIYNALAAKTAAKRIEQNNQLPQVELKQQNIENLKTLLNRSELLKHLPKAKIVAEIGVDKGDFSEEILELTSPRKLHLIDAWQGGRYNDGLKQQVQQKFKQQIDKGEVILNVGLSTDVLAIMPNGYFDWVYLDTDHSYQVTKEELNVLKLKLTAEGIIAGHDYISYDFVGRTRYGVIEAVNEFCVTENWEIIYLTAETSQYRSFAIRKIAG